MKLEDIQIPGYPSLDVILSHFDAIPILIEGLKSSRRNRVLDHWDVARNRVDRYKNLPVKVVMK